MSDTELIAALLEQAKAYRVGAKLLRGCDTSYLDTLIAAAENRNGKQSRPEPES